ncbi:hypothetical protein B0H13DRAFT_1873602 [Mycena leptocephala]|nr:hypothetical protein B0H13DRAFT_1873602 [Mycena leptocephala]
MPLQFLLSLYYSSKPSSSSPFRLPAIHSMDSQTLNHHLEHVKNTATSYLLQPGFYATPAKVADGLINLMEWEFGILGRQIQSLIVGNGVPLLSRRGKVGQARYHYSTGDICPNLATPATRQIIIPAPAEGYSLNINLMARYGSMTVGGGVVYSWRFENERRPKVYRCWTPPRRRGIPAHVMRRYENKDFFEDIGRLTPLRHRNFPFLGASSLMAPTPSIVMELGAFQMRSAHLFLNRIPATHLSIAGVLVSLEGHGGDNDIDSTPGRMMATRILESLPRPRPTCSSPFPPAEIAFGIGETDAEVERLPWRWADLDRDEAYFRNLAELFVDIYEQENEYCMGCDPEHRLFDLRSVSEQLHCDRVVDISPALVATGNLPYLDFPRSETVHPIELGSVACVMKSGRMVDIDEDTGPLHEGPFEESIDKGSGVLPESVGDYMRQTTTVSFHNPADSEIRRIQEYFLQSLQSLLHEHSWNCQLPTNGFVLVTLVKNQRSTDLTYNHDTKAEERSQDCLHCAIWGGQRHAEYKNEETSIWHIYFHAFPDRVIDAMDHSCWGLWTMSIEQADGNERELRLEPSQFSYTFERDGGFEGALVYLQIELSR